MKKGQVLDNLRKLMASKGIQAYIVPKNDEYMSSYIPKDKDRLYKLTNFTGSNGLAIVFQSQQKKPVFITDSRYKLQAKLEIDQELFEIQDPD